MTDLRKAAEMAFEALHNIDQSNNYDAIEALRQALAQPEQKQWQNLTDDEIKEIVGPWGETPIKGYTRKLFDQIEAKLRSKNT